MCRVALSMLVALLLRSEATADDQPWWRCKGRCQRRASEPLLAATTTLQEDLQETLELVEALGALTLAAPVVSHTLAAPPKEECKRVPAPECPMPSKEELETLRTLWNQRRARVDSLKVATQKAQANLHSQHETRNSCARSSSFSAQDDALYYGPVAIAEAERKLSDACEAQGTAQREHDETCCKLLNSLLQHTDENLMRIVMSTTGDSSGSDDGATRGWLGDPETSKLAVMADPEFLTAKMLKQALDERRSVLKSVRGQHLETKDSASERAARHRLLMALAAVRAGIKNSEGRHHQYRELSKPPMQSTTLEKASKELHASTGSCMSDHIDKILKNAGVCLAGNLDPAPRRCECEVCQDPSPLQ